MNKGSELSEDESRSPGVAQGQWGDVEPSERRRPRAYPVGTGAARVNGRFEQLRKDRGSSGARVTVRMRHISVREETSVITHAFLILT